MDHPSETMERGIAKIVSLEGLEILSLSSERKVSELTSNSLLYHEMDGIVRILIAEDTSAWSLQYPEYHTYQPYKLARDHATSRLNRTEAEPRFGILDPQESQSHEDDSDDSDDDSMSVISSASTIDEQEESRQSIATVFPVPECLLAKCNYNWGSTLRTQREHRENRLPHRPFTTNKYQTSYNFDNNNHGLLVLLTPPDQLEEVTKNVEIAYRFMYEKTLDFLEPITEWKDDYNLIAFAKLWLVGHHFGVVDFQNCVMLELCRTLKHAEENNTAFIPYLDGCETEEAKLPPTPVPAMFVCNTEFHAKSIEAECALTAFCYNHKDETRPDSARKLQKFCALRWMQRMSIWSETLLVTCSDPTPTKTSMMRGLSYVQMRGILEQHNAWSNKLNEDILHLWNAKWDTKLTDETLPWADESTLYGVYDFEGWAGLIFSRD